MILVKYSGKVTVLEKRMPSEWNFLLRVGPSIETKRTVILNTRKIQFKFIGYLELIWRFVIEIFLD